VIDFIEELIYLYHAVYNPSYFKNGSRGVTVSVEGLKIPISTEGIKHRENEPISFIIFAKDDKTFESLLRKTGWLDADPVTFLNSMRGAFCNLFNLSYDRFQLTPYFWNGKRHEFSLQMYTKKHTIRERHHARFWKSDLKTKLGQKIYVGMSSFDIGMDKLFCHTIDPDIDKERECLFKEFKKTGMIKSAKQISFSDKTEKSIFNGDLFFTDGKGYIIYLK
jgi:hypothetical protein